MFKLNANFIDGTKEVILPESWNELTFSRYVDLVNNDDKEWKTRLSVLTGIEKDDLGKLPVHAIDLLISVIGFIADLKPLNDANVAPEKYKDFKYSTSVEFTWHEEVLKELQKWTKFYKGDEADTPEKRDILLRKVQMSSAAKLVEVCTRKRTSDSRVLPGWNIKDEPVLNVIGMVSFFLHHLITYLNGTKN
jgi:hypothetical protein